MASISLPAQRLSPQLATAHQGGAALAVALILLLALTVLGVAALGANKLQTRLAFNAAESTIAFQASETALAAGEIWLAQQSEPPVPDCTQTSPLPTVPGSCATSARIWEKSNTGTVTTGTITVDNLLNAAWWPIYARKYGYNYVEGVTTSTTAEAGQVIPNLATEPRYVIQYVGVAEGESLDLGSPSTAKTYYYEISGRGTGALAEDNTVVQSIYAARY